MRSFDPIVRPGVTGLINRPPVTAAQSAPGPVRRARGSRHHPVRRTSAELETSHIKTARLYKVSRNRTGLVRAGRYAAEGLFANFWSNRNVDVCLGARGLA